MNLSDLGSTPLGDNVDVANLPQEMGSFAPQPPSGTYRFQLPRLSAEHFHKMETTSKGTRVRVAFDESAPLLIVQAPPSAAEAYLNTPYRTSINNAPRKRGKGDDAPEASDWDYLNRALGETTRPSNNMEFAQRLIAKSQQNPPVQFTADIEGSYRCDDNRDARFPDPVAGGNALTTLPATDAAGAPIMEGDKQANVKGCGRRYYEGAENKPAQPGKSGAVAKIDGQYPQDLTCECGAVLRRFTNLTRFRQ